MHKIYKLLRNNKQSGPYTINELAGLNLQSNDLIWIEGKTPGWHYPSEIDELQQLLHDRTPLQHQEKSTPPLQEKQKAEQPQNAKAKHVFVSFPANATNRIKTSKPANTATAPSMDEEEKELAARKQAFEMRAALMKQKVSAGSATTGNTTVIEEELDTKYNRSLEDMKQEYAAWLAAQKKSGKPSFSKKQVGVAVTLLLVALIGFWAINNFHPNRETAEKHATAPANTGITEVNEYESIPDNNEAAAIDPEVIPNYNNNDQNETTSEAVQPASIKKPVETKPQPETTTETATDPKAIAKTNNANEVPIYKLIDISEQYESTHKPGKGIEGLRLTVYNRSEKKLETVAVDVTYYDTNDRLLQKKTIYFNNMAPKSRLTQPAPSHKNAAFATYQLGLISSEGGLYYAMQ